MSVDDLPPLMSASQIAAQVGQENKQIGAALKELHPFVQMLNLDDLESCIALEDSCFPPHQRCTREKFIYRLSKCSDLCLGVFTSTGSLDAESAATASKARLIDSFQPQRKAILLAHIIATRSTHDLIEDDDMKLPLDWKDVNSTSQLGHQEHGRTVALHSLAVLPQFQGRGIGQMALKEYTQRVAGTADRIAILTYDRLLGFYSNAGFVDMGKSNAEFGGGEWKAMALDLSKIQADDYDDDDDE